MKAINNLVSEINTGLKNKSLVVKVQKTNLLIKFVQLFYEKGYIKAFLVKDEFIELFLNYKGGTTIFRGLTRISKSSKRVYLNKKNNRLLKLDGTYLLSTPKGLKIISIRGKETGFSGEVIFKIL